MKAMLQLWCALSRLRAGVGSAAEYQVVDLGAGVFPAGISASGEIAGVASRTAILRQTSGTTIQLTHNPPPAPADAWARAPFWFLVGLFALATGLLGWGLWLGMYAELWLLGVR
jgi:hypothetical protein